MTAIHLLAGEIGHAGIGERRVGGGTHERACVVLAKEGRNLRDVGVRNLLKPAPLIVCLALATALLMETADVAIASLFLAPRLTRQLATGEATFGAGTSARG